MENLLQLTDQPQHPILHQVGWVRLAKEISSFAHFEDNVVALQTPPLAKNRDAIEEEYGLLRLFKNAINSGEFQKYSTEQKKLI